MTLHLIEMRSYIGKYRIILKSQESQIFEAMKNALFIRHCCVKFNIPGFYISLKNYNGNIDITERNPRTLHAQK